MYMRQQEMLNEARKTLYQHGYENLEPIGDGGFATIYKVTSRQYREDFAVKLIDFSLDDSSSLPASFQAEITALTNLDHTNVIKIFNYFTSETILYIILEYCPGGSLKDYINKVGFIKQPVVLQLSQQIIRALSFCHEKGIAHRDVKPANILIDKYGRAKLADFGLAQHFNKSQRISIFGGSLPYLAPEILQQRPYDPKKADVWALGVTFYEMATGNLPYNETSPEKLLELIKTQILIPPPHFSSSFAEMIKRMIEFHAHDRIKLDDLIKLPIFRSVNHSFQRRGSKDFENTQKKKMCPVAVQILAVKSATTTSRKSLLYTKKRNVLSVGHTTFESASQCE